MKSTITNEEKLRWQHVVNNSPTKSEGYRKLEDETDYGYSSIEKVVKALNRGEKPEDIKLVKRNKISTGGYRR